MNIHLTPIAGLPLKALGGGAVIGETVRMAIQDGENVSSRIQPLTVFVFFGDIT